MKRIRQCTAVVIAAVLLTACSPQAPAPTAPSSRVAAAPTPSAAPAAPSSAPPPVADCVTATLDRLTLQQRVGQVLMVGTSVNTPDELGDEVARYHLGGVFLHGRSRHRAGVLRADVEALQRRAGLPLLISLDQEGGSVQTLKGPDFPIVPSAQRLGAGPPATLRASAGDTARRLAGIGVTLNLAPVADTVPTDVGRGNPPIGGFRRQYGSEPARVAAAIRTVVPASQDAGVLTVLKHFPGLGRVRANTDTSDDAVDDVATVNDPHLQPFVAGIEAGSAAVMMSSASYPRLDRSAIAAFSRPIVTGLLRDRLGFDGLIMSDDLGAGVAVSALPPGSRAVRFIAAGGDLVLTIRPKDAAPMGEALFDKAEKDQAFRARLADAARHVLEAKRRAGLLPCGQ
jgi:beta-N-acetylhexosaminidase